MIIKQKLRILLIFLIAFLPSNSLLYGLLSTGDSINPDIDKEVVIEDFDGGTVNLESYPDEDTDPFSWELDSQNTYNNSPWSLKIYGNTWKLQNIEPMLIDTGDVWQVSAYVASKAEIQGFGIMDSANVLFYSFAGSEEVNIDEWVAVYQGSFPEDQWNEYQLPVSDDWLASFGYLPKISALVYINDKDASTQGAIYFDHIVDITNDLPIIPTVSIDYITGGQKRGRKGKSIDIQFYSEVLDPDSEEHDFIWDFGDGSTSTEENPMHSFSVSDDHPYTVLLSVVDATNKWGFASCSVEVSQGSSSFPLTINFVGDMMMARAYEQWGGIIPTQGVEAIFEPTKPYLGDAADITVANLECPLTTYWGNHPTKTIYFKSSPANVDGLSYAGIDIVTLANNHILDYMLPGLLETQSVLEENEILHLGAGVDSYEAYLPAFYSKSGVNIAFLGASDRTGQYNNYQPYLHAGYNKPGFALLKKHYIKKQIAEVKEISDLVVMEWHSGGEYSFGPGSKENSNLTLTENFKTDEDYLPLAKTPDRGSRETRQFAIDHGADLVICHHPHIVHGVELYKGKLIAHSLGDFVFDLDYPETFTSMILNANVDNTGFYEFTLTPIYIDDYIPQRAEGGLGLHILDYIAQCSKDLDTYIKVDRENVIATVLMDTLNMPSYPIEYQAELNLENVNGNWETEPHRLEKAGSISSVDNIQPGGSYQFRLGREEIWWGNMEDEGCTLWDLNNIHEKYCDTVAFKGERSLQHTRDDNSPYNLVTNFEHRILCQSDTMSYSLAAYIKTQNGADVTIEIQYFQNFEGGYPIGNENIDVLVNGDTPWTFYHKELTIPAGTQFFDIRLNSNIPQSGTALSWFDNVSLIRWDNWDEYEILEPIPIPNDYYFLQAKSSHGSDEIAVNYSEMVFDDLYVGIENPSNETESLVELNQNFPNPFNPSAGATNISFDLNKTEKVRLTIFNINGQRVKVLADAVFQAGTHNLCWDGTNTFGRIVNSGVYFYELETHNLKHFKKCVLLRF